MICPCFEGVGLRWRIDRSARRLRGSCAPTFADVTPCRHGQAGGHCPPARSARAAERPVAAASVLSPPPHRNRVAHRPARGSDTRPCRGRRPAVRDGHHSACHPGDQPSCRHTTARRIARHGYHRKRFVRNTRQTFRTQGLTDRVARWARRFPGVRPSAPCQAGSVIVDGKADLWIVVCIPVPLPDCPCNRPDLPVSHRLTIQRGNRHDAPCCRRQHDFVTVIGQLDG